jgi:hypothetical protein
MTGRRGEAAVALGAVRQTGSAGGSAQRHLLGKPLRWSRGFTVVMIVWLAAGSLLLVSRLQMGHLTAWSGCEEAAVASVQRYEPDGAHSCAELLGVVATRLTEGQGSPRQARWYAFEREWEDRVYVVWEWSDRAALSFVVEGGAVRPDAETLLVLKNAARSLGSR